MKIPSGVITILLLFVICSCSTTKSENVVEYKEIMRFIETEISTNDTYQAGESIELSMKVTNIGKTKYTFLPWGTPIENRLTGDCLLVKYNNQILDYNGIMVKRIPPTKKDYITLKHNETVLGKINILEGYSLSEMEFTRFNTKRAKDCQHLTLSK